MSDFGKILELNLTTWEQREFPVSEENVKKYLGGRGFNSRLLFNYTKGKEDPLSSHNPLIFGAGLLTGTPAPCSSRYTVSAKSPLTGGIGDGNSGGFFGPEMRFAGYSHIVFLGRSKDPVYVYIEDDKVEIRNAKHLWGLDTWETTARIQEELGDNNAQVACIGQAGENLVKVSCIINNLTRAIGRSGMGAVMGSKNLKAVVVRGSGGTLVKNRAGAFGILDEMKELTLTDQSFVLFRKNGTPGLVDIYNSRGVFPVNNFQKSYLPDATSICAETFKEKFALKSKACYNCVIHCSHFYEVEGSHKEEGPEFESIGALGPRLGHSDYASILKANHLCNRFGLDTIGAGDAIGFAMECFEKGLLDDGQTCGLDLSWGNTDTEFELLRMMALREGLGDLLSQGSYHASRILGRGSEDLSMCVKGQALISADPRGLMGWGLGYAVANRGADHLRAHPVVEYCFTPEKAEEIWGTAKAVDRMATEGKGKLIKWCEDVRALADSLGICKFFTRTAYLLPEQLAKLIAPVTGLEFTADDLMLIGERINNLERSFNAREGFSRLQDTLPKRMQLEPIPEGPSKGMTIPLKSMLDEYYEARGWDVQTGMPSPEKLRQINL